MSDQDAPDLNLRGLVHDLNNVFQSILDGADLLAEDKKWGRVGGAIQRSAEHGQRLVLGLLEASGASCQFSVIAQNAIQFAVDFLQATQGPPVQFRASGDMQIRLTGNAVAWERVLVNLLLNSAQAMREGGHVELNAARDAEGIRISVVDEGPGIAGDILPRIFEAHFSTKPANTGLGLHIVRSLVEMNGGQVSASNREQGGAQFVIRLSPTG